MMTMTAQCAVRLDPVRVLVAAADDVWRLGLEMMIERTPGMVVIAAVTAAEAALGDWDSGVDVILLDAAQLSSPGASVTNICAGIDHCRVLVMRSEDQRDVAAEVISAGAAGVVRRDLSVEGLADALRRISANETVFDQATARELATSMRPAVASVPPLISRREREVLLAVAAGCTNTEAATRLFVSPQTIKTHLSRAYAKLGVGDRAAAVYKAVQLGLLD